MTGYLLAWSGFSIGAVGLQWAMHEGALLSPMPADILHEVRLLHGLRVPMRDGVRLSADVYVPRSGGPFPTIVTRTPYESGRDVFTELGVWWAERGYAFVVQDCRGRFESEGTFHAYFPDIEDGYDTLGWVAEQGWCNGRMGTWGRSYGALTQWLSAPLQSPHLNCMAPHVICDDFFSDCHYIGGAFQLLLSLGAAVIWETNLEIVTGRASRKIFQNRRFWEHLPLIELDERAIGRKIPYWREWLEHPTYDSYWQRCNTADRHAEIGVPAFQQCGWFDPYTASGFRYFNAMTQKGATPEARTQQRILVGPWSHEVPEGLHWGIWISGNLLQSICVKKTNAGLTGSLKGSKVISLTHHQFVCLLPDQTSGVTSTSGRWIVPGGRRIISVAPHMAHLMVDRGAGAHQVATAPRMHVTTEEPIEVLEGMEPEIIEGLQEMGHALEVIERVGGGAHGAEFLKEIRAIDSEVVTMLLTGAANFEDVSETVHPLLLQFFCMVIPKWPFSQ